MPRGRVKVQEKLTLTLRRLTRSYPPYANASVAQSVEQLTLNQLVPGSNPGRGTFAINKLRQLARSCRSWPISLVRRPQNCSKLAVDCLVKGPKREKMPPDRLKSPSIANRCRGFDRGAHPPSRLSLPFGWARSGLTSEARASLAVFRSFDLGVSFQSRGDGKSWAQGFP